jgi:shikimate 5-dehydrogenase
LSINGSKGQEVKLNLVDAAGRSLMTRSVTPESNSHREEVDMSNNKTGMYFMQVTSPLKNAALKVLKVSQD